MTNLRIVTDIPGTTDVTFGKSFILFDITLKQMTLYPKVKHISHAQVVDRRQK